MHLPKFGISPDNFEKKDLNQVLGHPMKIFHAAKKQKKKLSI